MRGSAEQGMEVRVAPPNRVSGYLGIADENALRLSKQSAADLVEKSGRNRGAISRLSRNQRGSVL